jgi:hypothetical protein
MNYAAYMALNLKLHRFTSHKRSADTSSYSSLLNSEYKCTKMVLNSYTVQRSTNAIKMMHTVHLKQQLLWTLFFPLSVKIEQCRRPTEQASDEGWGMSTRYLSPLRMITENWRGMVNGDCHIPHSIVPEPDVETCTCIGGQIWVNFCFQTSMLTKLKIFSTNLKYSSLEATRFTERRVCVDISNSMSRPWSGEWMPHP